MIDHIAAGPTGAFADEQPVENFTHGGCNFFWLAPIDTVFNVHFTILDICRGQNRTTNENDYDKKQ